MIITENSANFFKCTNFQAGVDSYQLSTHFNVSEFQSYLGSSYAPDIIVSKNLINMLEDLFSKLNCTSMGINSGYRTPEHSVAVGGSSSDQHTKGTAADIRCFNSNGVIDTKLVCCAAQDLGFSGIGFGGNYTHVDVRTSGRWWGDETNGRNVSDFYQYFGIEHSTDPDPEPDNRPDAATADNYVRTCYIEYLGRNADANGLQLYSDMLMNGSSESSIDNMFLTSTEYKQNFIKACYRILKGREAATSEISYLTGFSRLRDICNYVYPDNNVNNFIRTCYIEYLNRNVDASGINTFGNMLLNGSSESEVESAIIGSAEYKQLFIKDCFRLIYLREASTSEINTYSSMGRFRDIHEKIYKIYKFEIFVRTCYIEYVKRNADDYGLQYCINLYLNGSTEADIEHILLTSDEYKQLFIKTCYRVLKGREATASEVSYLTGFSRLRDMCNYVYPDSTVNNYVRTCYIEYLNRNVDASGLNTFGNMLLNGASEAKIDALIKGSIEYKQIFIKNCISNLKGRAATAAEITKYSAYPLLRDICNDVSRS